MDSRLAEYISRLQRPVPNVTETAPFEAPPPRASFMEQLAATGLRRRAAALAATHVTETCLMLGSWVFAGFGALSGRLDPGWIVGWALCLMSTVPLRAYVRAAEGTVAVGVGGLLKERLLVGAMAMNPDQIRRSGVGHLVGEVLEADAIESLGASGGMDAFLALLELVVSPILLGLGAVPNFEIPILAGWILVTFFLITWNTNIRFQWTGSRIRITRRTVESMIGHRTRLAQQRQSEWHGDEDDSLKDYLRISQKLDRTTALLQAGAPRAYLVMGLIALVPTFLSGTFDVARQTLTLGALLFAASSLEQLTMGLANASTAWVAWKSITPIFEAAARPANNGALNKVSSSSNRLLFARDVIFTHPGQLDPALKGCSLSVDRGEFLLFEGGPGSGKSTFAALLAGLNCASGGVILSGGLDRNTLGDTRWRQRIALAPQYHENHILSASMSFNLLLGRSYPHSVRDLEEAAEICNELGLGRLLESMPAGLDQIVGETGWQLSQGERSRVFLARALLQRADLIILDESLAALDPENLEQCLLCVMKRAKTLMVIAHP